MSLPVHYAGKVPEGCLYVPRQVDSDFCGLFRKPGSWANVFGCRGMGKSSLYEQHRRELSETYDTLIQIDIAFDFEDNIPSSLEWVRRLAIRIQEDPSSPYRHLDSVLANLPHHTTASTALEKLFLGVLEQSSGNVLVILDEYDSIKDLTYANDIVGDLRHLQNITADRSSLQRLSMCLVGLRPITHYAVAGSPGSSTFTLLFEMKDFDSSDRTIQQLAKAFLEGGVPERDALEQLLRLSGGQPLVTMTLLWYMVERGLKTPQEVQELAEELVAPSGRGADLDHFATIQQTLLNLRSKAFHSLSAYRELIERGDQADSREIDIPRKSDLLLVTGLVRRRTDRKLEPKGDLFRRRFGAEWVNRMLDDLTQSRDETWLVFRKLSDPRRQKRICIINTGGTIGMVERGGEVVRPESEEEFLQYFKALNTIAESIEYVTLEQDYRFEPRDSINVFPDQWISLADYIYRRRHQVDAFIVCHGTDTMAYTASAVAFALGPNLGFPVVFTGAQTTPDIAYGDAHVNLYRACEVALQPIHEVVISFGNFVYRAVRAQKRDDRRFDGFESPTYPPLAEITGDIFVRSELLRPKPAPGVEIELKAEFEREILMIPQYPGLDPQLFEDILEQRKCRGIILQTLGAGNVASEKPYSFIPFVDRAKRLGIPVIVTSQYPPDPGSYTKYGPATQPLQAGAIHAGNMTQAAAVVKFRWVLADLLKRKEWPDLTSDDKKELVAKNMTAEAIIGEF